MSPRELRQLIDRMVTKLRQEYGPDRVILFGSHAYGEPRPDSDIDLLIIKDTEAAPLDRWSEVRRILSDPDRTVGLEVLVLTPAELARRIDAGDQFIEEIVSRGRVLHAA